MYRWLTVIIMLAVLNSSAFAEGISGYANINDNTSKQYENGQRLSTQNTFNRNFYLRLDKSITPMLSYQAYLRSSYLDTHSTNDRQERTVSYQRTAEPSIDLYFRNPIYDFSTGYRRLEQWSTAHLVDDSRRTTEFLYSRLNITPYEFPSFSFQVERQKDYDYLSSKKIDATSTRYYGSSWYQYSAKDLNASYNLNYTHNTNETPLGIVSKTIYDTVNGSYTLGYSKPFWGDKARVSAGYNGNYTRGQNTQFAVKTGSLSLKRAAIAGLYASGALFPPTFEVPITTSDSKLIDAPANALSSDTAYSTPTAINIGNNAATAYYNIGIQLPVQKSVDTLYLYVNKDVHLDANLTNAANWKVYSSNTNIATQWTQITPVSVAVTLFDVTNTIYRYEFKFLSVSAQYFKVVNQMKTQAGIGGGDVFVTELEAYGTDFFASGKNVDITELFSQGLNFDFNVKPISTLIFSMNYSITRSDQNLNSISGPITGLFQSLVTKKMDDKDPALLSNVSRSYGAATTWLANKRLTATVRVQRSEAFDNKKQNDFSSNMYALTFNSPILPTLDATLSLLRTNNYSFSTKDSTNDNILLNIGSRLYKDVNMITDLGLTKSTTYKTDITSTTRYIRGNIDTIFTKNLFGTFTYSFNWSDVTGSASTRMRDGGIILTYRPGRFINLSGSFKITDTNGAKTTTEGLLVDWLPVPTLKLNMNYQYSYAEQGHAMGHTLQSYAVWYITKFTDLQLTQGYALNRTEKRTENYNFGLNLNCRFW